MANPKRGFLRRLFGRSKSRAPRESTSIAQFARSTARGSADCRIKISEIPKLVSALSNELSSKGVSTYEKVDLIDTRLSGRCPKCGTCTGGQHIQKASTLSGAGRVAVLFEPPGGSVVGRLLMGRCPNARCSSTDILVSWRP